MIGGNHWVSFWLAKSLEWQYLPMRDIPTADAIVVLGGATEPAQFPALLSSSILLLTG